MGCVGNDLSGNACLDRSCGCIALVIYLGRYGTQFSFSQAFEVIAGWIPLDEGGSSRGGNLQGVIVDGARTCTGGEGKLRLFSSRSRTFAMRR